MNADTYRFPYAIGSDKYRDLGAALYAAIVLAQHGHPNSRITDRRASK